MEEIRENYENWYQGKKEAARLRFGEQEERKHERFASLDVMGISALEGYVVVIDILRDANLIFQDWCESSG